MNGPGGINPWPRPAGTPATSGVAKTARSELAERMMLARLFGHDEPETPDAPQPPVVNRARNDDEFTSNLGRYVDLTA